MFRTLQQELCKTLRGRCPRDWREVDWVGGIHSDSPDHHIVFPPIGGGNCGKESSSMRFYGSRHMPSVEYNHTALTPLKFSWTCCGDCEHQSCFAHSVCPYRVGNKNVEQWLVRARRVPEVCLDGAT